MEKRKLSLDELQVESFSTSDEEKERGTVAGHQVSEPYVCYTDEYCGCNDWISQRSCRVTCHLGAGSGCVNTTSPCQSGNPFTCRPEQSCNPDATCVCTAYTQPC